MAKRLALLVPLSVVMALVGAFFSYRALTGSSQDASQPEAIGGPTGTETVLRIAAPATIACQREPFEAQIFVDDLERIDESALDGYPFRGVLGVQGRIRFDPSVLNVSNVVLPDARNQNPDASDAARHWLMAAPRIDNETGAVLVGAVAAISAVDEQREPGIDPVEAGQPLLIMTVTVHTVGQGSSDVTLEELKVLGGPSLAFDTKPINTSIRVESGECAARVDSNWPPQQSSDATPIPAYHTDVIDCRPSIGGGVTQELDPACARLTQPSSIPTPQAGCDWTWGNTQTGWVFGDLPIERSNAFVEVCDGYLSGRAWNFTTERIDSVPTRQAPIEAVE